ncbi:ATP-dependent DNA helicase 2 subunit KU80 [Glycine max]|nr:ATP-dependent DNA helicase 2 subunit KU80 [Glycine max]
MHPALSEIEKVCSMLVQKKLIYSKYDEVGIVLFGTEDTNNELTTEVVLDAVIVGKDMERNVCLIRNAKCRIKEFDEGTKEEQVTTIAKQMTAHGIKMESIIMRGKLSQDANKGIMDENDRLLNIFSKETSTRLLYVENPISLFGALRTRNGAPVIVLEGHLEINPTLSIKGAKIGATLWQKLFPEYEAKLQCGSAYVIQNIKVVKNHSEYKVSTISFLVYLMKTTFVKEIDRPEIPPNVHVITQFGVAPRDTLHDKERNDEVWLCKENEPVLRVGGDFFHLRSTPFCLLSPAKKRNLYSGHHYMKDVYVSLPKPGNTRAMIAVSVVARAMKEMNKVAIVRCVWRQRHANVVIGVLTPNLSDKENIVASWQPNGQQLEATANLIKKLDLAPHGQEEVLLPDFTPNPVLEKKSRRLLGGKRSFSNDEEVKGNITAQPANLIGNASVKVGKIGDLTLVQYFEALI